MLIRILLCIAICFIKEISDARIKREKVFEPHLFSSCFEDIGCIDFNEKWFHEKHRPKNKEPLDRHTIRTEFLMMKNPKNDTNHLVYDVMSFRKETIEVAGFKKGTCSIFIIHDFTSNGYTGWIKHMVVAFSRKTDCNIISVDWEAGAEPPFDQAISNARVVALESKHFINVLKSCFSQTPDNLHLVGHGVGAHIAGYIGKYVPGLQRITGLDPTGPLFEKMPKEVRLDASDARYVEIIHTDNFNHRSQGGRAPHGHADFYVNNAEHQPGCNDSSEYPSFQSINRDNIQEGKILPACSHKRSFKYYIESLEDDNCQFIAVRCSNINDFKLGKCNDCTNAVGKCGKCATFGLVSPSVNTENNTYYLQTNGKKPFCLLSYSVNITIAGSDLGREVEGYFELILVDEHNKVTNASNDVSGKNIRKFNTGTKYPFIFYAPPPAVNRIKEAKVKWTYKSKKICIMCDKSISVKEIEIKRMSIKSANNIVSRICPAMNGSTLKDQDYVQFENCLKKHGPNYVKNLHIPLKEGHLNKSEAAMKGTTKPPPPICEIEVPGTNSSSTKPAHGGSSAHTARGIDESEDVADTTDSFIYPDTDIGEKRGVNDKDTEKEIKGFKDCFDESLIKSTTEKASIIITRFGKRKRKSRESGNVSNGLFTYPNEMYNEKILKEKQTNQMASKTPTRYIGMVSSTIEYYAEQQTSATPFSTSLTTSTQSKSATDTRQVSNFTAKNSNEKSSTKKSNTKKSFTEKVTTKKEAGLTDYDFEPLVSADPLILHNDKKKSSKRKKGVQNQKDLNILHNDKKDSSKRKKSVENQKDLKSSNSTTEKNKVKKSVQSSKIMKDEKRKINTNIKKAQFSTKAMQEIKHNENIIRFKKAQSSDSTEKTSTAKISITEKRCNENSLIDKGSTEKLYTKKMISEKGTTEKSFTEKRSTEKRSTEKYFDNISTEKKPIVKDSTEKDLTLQDFTEKYSKEFYFTENDFIENKSTEKKSIEKNSTEKDSTEINSTEKDLTLKDLIEKYFTEEKYSSDKQFSEIDSTEKNNEKYSTEFSFTENDSIENKSTEKDSTEINSSKKDSIENISTEENSNIKDSTEKDSLEKYSIDKDSTEIGSTEKNLIEKYFAEKDSTEKDFTEQYPIQKDLIEKHSIDEKFTGKDSTEKISTKEEVSTITIIEQTFKYIDDDNDEQNPLINADPLIQNNHKRDAEKDKYVKDFKDCFDENSLTMTTEKFELKRSFIKKSNKRIVTPRTIVLGKQELVAYPAPAIYKKHSETQTDEFDYPTSQMSTVSQFDNDTPMSQSYSNVRDEGFYLPEVKTDDLSIVHTENPDLIELNNNEYEEEILPTKNQRSGITPKQKVEPEQDPKDLKSLTTEHRFNDVKRKIVTIKNVSLQHNMKRNMIERNESLKKTKKRTDKMDDIDDTLQLPYLTSQIDTNSQRQAYNVRDEGFLPPEALTDDPSILATEKHILFTNTQYEEDEEELIPNKMQQSDLNNESKTAKNLKQFENIDDESSINDVNSLFKNQKSQSIRKRKQGSRVNVNDKNVKQNSQQKRKICQLHKRQNNGRELTYSNKMEEFDNTGQTATNFPAMNLPNNVLEKESMITEKSNFLEANNSEYVGQKLPFRSQRDSKEDQEAKQNEKDLKSFKACFDEDSITSTTVDCYDTNGKRHSDKTQKNQSVRKRKQNKSVPTNFIDKNTKVIFEHKRKIVPVVMDQKQKNKKIENYEVPWHTHFPPDLDMDLYGSINGVSDKGSPYTEKSNLLGLNSSQYVKNLVPYKSLQSNSKADTEAVQYRNDLYNWYLLNNNDKQSTKYKRKIPLLLHSMRNNRRALITNKKMKSEDSWQLPKHFQESKIDLERSPNNVFEKGTILTGLQSGLNSIEDVQEMLTSKFKRSGESKEDKEAEQNEKDLKTFKTCFDENSVTTTTEECFDKNKKRGLDKKLNQLIRMDSTNNNVKRNSEHKQKITSKIHKTKFRRSLTYNKKVKKSDDSWQSFENFPELQTNLHTAPNEASISTETSDVLGLSSSEYVEDHIHNFKSQRREFKTDEEIAQQEKDLKTFKSCFDENSVTTTTEDCYDANKEKRNLDERQTKKLIHKKVKNSRGFKIFNHKTKKHSSEHKEDTEFLHKRKNNIRALKYTNKEDFEDTWQLPVDPKTNHKLLKRVSDKVSIVTERSNLMNSHKLPNGEKSIAADHFDLTDFFKSSRASDKISIATKHPNFMGSLESLNSVTDKTLISTEQSDLLGLKNIDYEDEKMLSSKSQRSDLKKDDEARQYKKDMTSFKTCFDKSSIITPTNSCFDNNNAKRFSDKQQNSANNVDSADSNIMKMKELMDILPDLISDSEVSSINANDEEFLIPKTRTESSIVTDSDIHRLDDEPEEEILSKSQRSDNKEDDVKSFNTHQISSTITTKKPLSDKNAKRNSAKNKKFFLKRHRKHNRHLHSMIKSLVKGNKDQT